MPQLRGNEPILGLNNHQEMYHIHVMSYTKCNPQQCIHINENHTPCANASRVYQE
jgi:hypothetical protein